MLEFLEECDQFHIADRAGDCEMHLNAFDCVTPIAVFFEVILKAHLAYFFPPEASEEAPNLFRLLNNKPLMDLIREKYGFDQEDTVHQIRIRSNAMKHDAGSEPVGEEEKKKYFRCLFDFACGYYAFHSGREAPAWDEGEYRKLICGTDRDRAEAGYAEKIAELSYQLEQERSRRVLDRERLDRLDREIGRLRCLERMIGPGLRGAAREEDSAPGGGQDTAGPIPGAPAVSDGGADDRGGRKGIRLTENQQRAVDCGDKYVLTVAGPGSGKTLVLTERIARLISRDNVQGDRILALSFSSRAANEVRKRLKDVLDFRSSRVRVKTFHSFGLGVIRRYCDLLGYPDGVEIINSTGKNRIIRDILDPKRGKGRDRALSEMSLSELQYYAQEISRIKSGQPAGDPGIAYLCEKYDEELKRGGYIDFDDMVAIPRRLFLEHPDIRAAYKKSFDHVLIDEVQDINSCQLDMIRGIVGPQTSLFVVGDDDQCIYEWRGAIPSYIRGLAANDAFTVIRLDENFRSETAIVRASASFIDRNGDRIRKTIRPCKTRNTGVTSSAVARWLPGEKAEAGYIAETVGKLTGSGLYRLSDVTVLARSRKQFPAIESAFAAAGIPLITREERPRYDSFIHVLRAVSDIREKGRINRAVNYPDRIMDNFLYQDLREKFRLPEEWSVYETFEYLCDSDLQFDDCGLFRSRFGLIRDIGRRIGLLTVSEVVKRLYGYYTSEDKRREEDTESLRTVLELAEDFDKGYSPSDDSSAKAMDEFLDYLRLVGEDDSQEDPAGDAVTLMTCHHSKGLEFPVVFIPGIQCGTFPDDHFINCRADLEAERRLLYVSMTRAIDKLYLTCNDDPYRGGGKYAFRGFLADIPDIVLQKG